MRTFRDYIAAPFIYLMFIPLLIFHLCLEFYVAVVFAISNIPKPTRHNYFVFDRYQLTSIGFRNRIYCFYCSYANGLMGYAREVVARTERYWCPIKHKELQTMQHEQYKNFLEYGEDQKFVNKREELRAFDELKE